MAEGMTLVEDRELGGNVRMISVEWTSAPGGTVSQPIKALLPNKKPIVGILNRLVTNPDGTDAPTDDYDLTLLDGDSVDVLNGGGANRDTANTEEIYPSTVGVGTNSDFQPAIAGDLTVTIAAAGNTKKGRVILYLITRA